MNGLSRQFAKGFAGTATRTVVLSMAAMLIAACTKGDGVQIGTGQDADPVVIDFPIGYIKAPIPTDNNGLFEQEDLREQITFDFGADLYYRDRAAVGAEPVNITGDMTQGLGAIRDVEIDYDGSRLLFAMRTPVDPNVDEVKRQLKRIAEKANRYFSPRQSAPDAAQTQPCSEQGEWQELGGENEPPFSLKGF